MLTGELTPPCLAKGVCLEERKDQHYRLHPQTLLNQQNRDTASFSRPYAFNTWRHGTLEAYCRCIDVGGMEAHKMELN